MNNILSKIIMKKQFWIKERKKKQPLNDFKNKLKFSTRNFKNALTQDQPSYILEYKKGSPSSGIINNNFNLKHISRIYKKYASAVSVLTDEDYFFGKFDYLFEVSTYISQPLLCKDFFISAYQVYLARYYQADAVLLILSILTDNQYLYLSQIAKSLNMDILTEVSNETEIFRAIELKSEIIGINNRNLNNLSININRTIELAPKIPKNIIVISESGITCYQQIRNISRFVHGFLIGSVLMRSNDLQTKISQVIMGDNKICGLTRKEDAIVSKKAGMIYGGIIFYRRSARNLSINLAQKIVNSINLKYVGVFCNEKVNNIVSIATYLNLYAVQLHGFEDQSYIADLREKLPHKINIWKAFGISNIIPETNIKHVNFYIFDNVSGGSGITFDWSILKKRNYKNTDILLSGGLNPENCIYASKLGFSGLDFNSGVETSPGIKSSKKIFLSLKKLRYFKHNYIS